MQRRARNTGARKSGAAELDTTEMRAPHLNRLAVPTCREDSSRHASEQNGGAGAPCTGAGWRPSTTAKTAAQTAVTGIKRSPGTRQDI